MKYKDIEKILKSLLCVTLAFLLLTQPCFAFVNQPIPPIFPPVANSLPYLPSLSITKLRQQDVSPDSKTLRKFVSLRAKNFLAAVGINSPSKLMFTSFHKFGAHLANQLLNLNNSIAQEKGGKPPPNIEELSLLEEGYPAIRKSGTRLSGNQYIRDNVPDLRITQSPSPGSPDNQITFLEQSSFPKHIEYLASSIEHLLFSPKNAEAQSLPLLNSQYSYTYDTVGNRLTQQAQWTQQTQQTNYAYNNIYELTAVTGAQTHNYDYDAVGNREAVDGTNYSANNLNQYSVVGADPYRYDANGNLIDDNHSTFTYDAENRLTLSTHQPYTTYQYDGFGRRIQKNNDNERIFYYIYDGDRIIEERYDNGSLAASYVYGEGVDEVLTMTKGAQTYYYFYDGLGSVADIADNSGNVVESYQYDVYGQPNITSTIGNRFMFTGREYDEESGLYYYRARMYSPAIGRFLQRDPLTWGPDDRRILFELSKTTIVDIVRYFKNINVQNILLNDEELIIGILEKRQDRNIDVESEWVKKILMFAGKQIPQLQHRYNYCFNNPLIYVDPTGEFIDPVTAGLVLLGTTIVIIGFQCYLLYKYGDINVRDKKGNIIGPMKVPGARR